jgi:hypothetical protein
MKITDSSQSCIEPICRLAFSQQCIMVRGHKRMFFFLLIRQINSTGSRRSLVLCSSRQCCTFPSGLGYLTIFCIEHAQEPRFGSLSFRVDFLASPLFFWLLAEQNYQLVFHIVKEQVQFALKRGWSSRVCIRRHPSFLWASSQVCEPKIGEQCLTWWSEAEQELFVPWGYPLSFVEPSQSIRDVSAKVGQDLDWRWYGDALKQFGFLFYGFLRTCCRQVAICKQSDPVWLQSWCRYCYTQFHLTFRAAKQLLICPGVVCRGSM